MKVVGVYRILWKSEGVALPLERSLLFDAISAHHIDIDDHVRLSDGKDSVDHMIYQIR